MQVAPAEPGRPKEVMIAISNYALVSTNMLPLWLKVCFWLCVIGPSGPEDVFQSHSIKMVHEGHCLDSIASHTAAQTPGWVA